MNGTVSGNKEGEYIYIGARGCTIIDYIIVNETCINKVINFKVDNIDRIDSDHLSLILTIWDREEEEERGAETNHMKIMGGRTVIRRDKNDIQEEYGRDKSAEGSRGGVYWD